MKTSDFDFDLPKELIAQTPADPRDSARLLTVGVDGSSTLDDRSIRDLPDLFQPGDILVRNNTKVIPSRVLGRRGEAKVEITLHKPNPATSSASEQVWWGFARPAKRLKPGDRIDIAVGFSATVQDRVEGEVLLSFEESEAGLFSKLDQFGQMPLPPYISRKDGPDARDRERYQTVFAERPGAVAAPTASLHFTDAILAAIQARGVEIVDVTLHVGAGTFLPVKAEDPRDHQMHGEWFEMSAQTAATLNSARGKGGRLIAAGTTAMRTLESVADDAGHFEAKHGETKLFILPGYRFKAVDALITNFHLPQSTLFMLVCAFSGTKTMKAAYAHAIEEEYRFFSYGDGSFLVRDDELHEGWGNEK